MSGPYKLDMQTITEVVERISHGAYVLSANSHTAHYVGRSDSDVAGRLKWWVENSRKYTHFWCEYANSSKEAFEIECRWYHKYKPVDNDKHPERSRGANWECPDCSIFDKKWG